MKHISTLLLLFISFSGFSQLIFSADTVDLMLEPGVSHKAYIDVTNRGNPVDLTWYRVQSQLNTDWDVIQFCECSLCYDFKAAGVRDSASCTNFTGGGIGWYLEADPGTVTPTAGIWQIAVHDQTNDLWDTLTWTVSVPSNVYNLSDNVSITGYPNPAKNNFTVNYDIPQTGKELVLNITNVLGQNIHSEVLPVSNGQVQIDLSNFQSGLYIYRVEQEGELVGTAKFQVAK